MEEDKMICEDSLFDINEGEFPNFADQLSNLNSDIFDVKSNASGSNFQVEHQENTGSTHNAQTHVNATHVINRPQLVDYADHEAVVEILTRIKRVEIGPLGEKLSEFAKSLVRNRRKMYELYDVLVKSDTYLPPLKCKRLTYKYLIGIVEGKFIAVKSSQVQINPYIGATKASTRVLMYEIGKLAKLRSQGTGFYLSRPFPRMFYIQVLHALDPNNIYFERRHNPLIPDGERPNPEEIAGALAEEVPMPENFRGLIRFERERIKDLFYGNMFGGFVGMKSVQTRFAMLNGHLEDLRRTLISIKKNLRDLNGAVEGEDTLMTLIRLLVP